MHRLWSVVVAVGVCAALPDAAALAAPTTPETASRASPAKEGERARAAFARGQAASAAGDFAKARDAFAEACALAPDWALAALEHGLAALAANADDQAGLAALERAVALAPQNARAHLQLGLAYGKRDRHEDTVRELRAASALRGEFPEARFPMARALLALGQTDEALAEYNQVVARDPGNLAALSDMADIYEAKGQRVEAELVLMTVARLYPTVPYNYYRLAQFYERIGEPDKAKRAYSEVERLDPRQRAMRKLK